MKENLESRINKVKQALDEAECVVIGGGAGLSAAAGLDYTGRRFTENFRPFIKKYGMTDMYTSSFYPFKQQEEKWAYWAQHISVNLYNMPVTDLYMDLLGLVQNKKYFVITTNVERQFHKAGFLSDKIFAVQGDYGSRQCAKGCHNILYDNEQLVKEMIKETKDCAIPSALVPVCPVCGGPMDVNVHKDAYFVQDVDWEAANERYILFLKETEKAKSVFLELGVGYNTPGIIRYPFEQMTHGNEQAVLIRLNQLHPEGANENRSRTIAFTEEMSEVMAAFMMINTGARTDIPAFFSEWLCNRLQSGFVCVRNPYYPEQVTRYRLTPDVVDCILFCTKNPRPLLARLQELEAFGVYFFVTITPYGADVEPRVPPVNQVMADFQKLSVALGHEKVCWRYDPIYLSHFWSIDRHLAAFAGMAKGLSGYTEECVISFIDLYEKTKRNFPEARALSGGEKIELAKGMAKIGATYHIAIKTCAEPQDLRAYGIGQAGCLTKSVLEKACGITLKTLPHKPSRPSCGCCVSSHDIGSYNTCPHGCHYCYANENQKLVEKNVKRHNPHSPLLIGELTEADIVRDARQESYRDVQMVLF